MKMQTMTRMLTVLVLALGLTLRALADTPVAILNGSFEEGASSITATVDGGIEGKGIGYTTYDCIEYFDIVKDNGFHDTLVGLGGQPTGDNGRPRYWTFTGQGEDYFTDSRWGDWWASWIPGQTDGHTAIILDNRTTWSDPQNSTMKQTLSLNVGQLKALGSSLKMYFDARDNSADSSAGSADIDGDDYIRAYFEVDGVRDVAGTWETTLDAANKKVRTFSVINGGSTPTTLYGTPVRANPSRAKPGSVSAANMDTFFATLDLSSYGDSSTVKIAFECHRERDDGVASASRRVYLDNVRVVAVSAAPTIPGTLIYGK